MSGFLVEFFSLKRRLLVLSLVAVWSLTVEAAPKNESTAEIEAGLGRSYAYFANGEPLGGVVQNLSKNFGLTLKLNGAFQEPVTGRIGGETAAEMLSRLSEMYGFNWFVFGKTLYVSRGTDRVVQRLKVTPGSADSLKQALIDIGLITPRFGWGSVPEEDAVIITGPRDYVNLVMATVSKMESGENTHTMVFRLKYASVEDRRIQLRDREVVTRGLASILANLLGAKGSRATSQGANSGGTVSPGQAIAPAQGKLLDGVDTPVRPSTVEPTKTSGNGPVIESDPRLNAIIVRDHISRKQMYADLIAELDVPSPLVEIEASIIEIDQSKFDEIGAQWSYGSASFRAQSFSSDNPQTGTKGGLNLDFSSGSTSIIRDLRGFNATLRLLESAGEAKVLAKPAVMTLDNLGAVLDLTDTSYTSVVGERVANIVPVTVGTLLRVTPHVIQEANNIRIQLAVDIEDGSQEAGAGSNVRVKKTNISTQAIIEPSQSLLIAGYSLEQESSGTSGIPVLGRIPILGAAFSTQSKSSKRLKRLFLITPRVQGVDITTAAASLPIDLGTKNGQAPFAKLGSSNETIRNGIKVPEGTSNSRLTESSPPPIDKDVSTASKQGEKRTDTTSISTTADLKASTPPTRVAPDPPPYSVRNRGRFVINKSPAPTLTTNAAGPAGVSNSNTEASVSGISPRRIFITNQRQTTSP